jgi:preprotein translocase subunit SecD
MQKNYSIKHYGTIIILLLFGLLYSLPNVYGNQPAVQIRAEQPMNSHVWVNKISQILKEKKQPFLNVTPKDKGLIITFATTEGQIAAHGILLQSLRNASLRPTIALTLIPKTPAWLQAIRAAPMKLGLDLQGGVHLLLKVDTNAVLQARAKGDIQTMKKNLRKARIRYQKITPRPNQTWHIAFANHDTQHKAEAELKRTFGEWTIQASNESRLIIQLRPEAIKKMTDYVLSQTIGILNNRVNELGVSEATVQRQGDDAVSVDLPGIQDTARAKALIGKTATLYMAMEDDSHDLSSVLQSGNTPFGSKLFKDESGRPVLLKTQKILLGKSITYASAAMRDGRPAVNIHLGGGGESLFYRTTAGSVGKRMAVVFVETEVKSSKKPGGKPTYIHHERVISLATIQSSLGNNFDILSLPSMEYAQNLSLLLRSGALIAPVHVVEEMTVGPSLGQANIHRGILSMEVGSLLVIIFMCLYYRLFGFVANLALTLNVLLIVACLSLIEATLTLPGIAGIVLTVGMAVDANVLINERIREELRAGMAPLQAIHAGYERAFGTIVDANVTTLIVAMILFGLGSGSVKGFAITLIIGLLASMITSIFFTRAIIQLIYRDPQKVKHLSIGIRVA